ncbi:MAG: hypothetical protein AAF581_04550 [Planctomycetota bacterium]
MSTLKRYWAALDQLLRGKIDATGLSVVRVWTFWQIVGAALYGLALGVYALANHEEFDRRFLVAGAAKMPLLLLLTTVITCPSLYVFGALQGLRFSASQFVSMLIVAHTVLAAVLGSLAPVLAFFSVTTRSYSFMVLSAVATCALAGGFGLRWFFIALRVSDGDDDDDAAPSVDAPVADVAPESVTQAKKPRRPRANVATRALWKVLSWWLLLYIFVGAQLGWMLRPFVGDPTLQFEWFRPKSGSFIDAVLKHLGNMIGG